MPTMTPAARPPSLHVIARLPVGIDVEGVLRRAPWYGKRVRGRVARHRTTERGRWVVCVINSIGTADLPADDREYAVHEENVMRYHGGA